MTLVSETGAIGRAVSKLSSPGASGSPVSKLSEPYELDAQCHPVMADDVPEPVA
jgi:hypothetical protein